MSLTAKAATSSRVASDGDGTLGSGFGHAARGSGAGNVDAGFVTGAAVKQVYVAVWDDTLDGHVPAAGSLGLGVTIPKGFVVTEVYMDVEVVPVGPTNMFVSLENDADLVTSAAIAGAPWSTTGIKHGANADAGAVQVATTVQGPLTTTAREIAIGGTVAASSAGRVVIYVEGFTRPQTLTQGAAS